MPGFARPELIATPAWLAENLGRPGLRVVDLRWRPDGTHPALFATGHVPGAAHLDWRTGLVDGETDADALLLAPPEQFAAAVGAAGVGDGASVVLYDDTVGFHAARAWWSLAAYGLGSVRVLDGGWPAWTAAGHVIEHGTPAVPGAVFTPRADPRVRLTTADIRGLLGRPEVLLVDARGPAEYRGHEGNTRRLGHVPGAVSVPVAAVHEPGTQRLRAADDLRALLLKAGVTRGRRIVCYDGSGIAAARLAQVLALLGHDDVAVYDGGWAEWGNRLDLPVER